MKAFHFKNFSINQSKDVFRVGTDGVLLGILSKVKDAQNILEVGTGTGLISLMVAQRNPTSKILALDINQNAFNLALENFKNSPFNSQLQVKLKDFKKFKTEEKFDLIISNPPYFEENSSDKDVLARQQTELTFETLIQKAALLLSENGSLSVIIPFESGEYFIKTANRNALFISKRIKIVGIKNGPPKRWILEFTCKNEEIVEEEFTIEKAPRAYSDEYLDLTKDFHQFKN